MLFGKNFGMKTLAVLTGITDQQILDSASAELTPHYYADSIAEHCCVFIPKFLPNSTSVFSLQQHNNQKRERERQDYTYSTCLQPLVSELDLSSC